ncbi:unnamed protein product [Paramecium pentaurelia]|uniref:Uncharacterized protein n=1 Tax=Paramecium pentaurelia TaxID=43138 RepID=A0A8S1SI12_9CILI|nr:unnamed protein product [Paramecium pentaurelia]
MDEYDDEFSDNSIEITINEYQGKESHITEKSIIRYLKNLGLKMKTNPMIKQLQYERSNNQIIDVLTSKALSSQGNILKETETDYNTLFQKNPFLKRIRKQSSSLKVLHHT